MNEKILIIDDDPDLRRLAKLILSRQNYQVYEARNGIEGIEQMYKASPDLVILDVMMPKMDGWETCRRIREFSDVRILVLSAKTDRGSRFKGSDLGADDYLTKPFAPQELLDKVEAMLRADDPSS